MLWLARPPYLRWIAAGALVVAALMWDLSERETESFPFAVVDLERGQPITAADIEWRDMPAGAFIVPDLVDATALVPIRSGDPIVPSLASTSPALPSNSWAVPVPLPLGAGAGTAVKLVFPDGSDVAGVVIQSAGEDSFGFDTTGLVAVVEQAANAVALASANGDLVVLVEP